MSEWSVCDARTSSDASTTTRLRDATARRESRLSSSPSVVVCRCLSSWCKKCARHDDGVGDDGDEGRGAVASASVRWRRMRVGVVVAAVCRARARE